VDPLLVVHFQFHFMCMADEVGVGGLGDIIPLTQIDPTTTTTKPPSTHSYLLNCFLDQIDVELSKNDAILLLTS
jgi:hypothetical protein